MDFMDLLSKIIGAGGNTEVLQAAGTGLAAYGSYQQGASTSSAYKFNAAVADNNAIMSAQQGDFAASMAYNKGRRVLGQAAANYGASGVQMDGSPLDVLADSTRGVISDTLMARQPFATRSTSLAMDAVLDRNAAGNARTSSYFQMGTDLARGAARLRGGGSYFNFGGSDGFNGSA